MDINSTVTLNNGIEMPLLGLGVFRSQAGEECRAAVRTALEYGYHMIDTARIYCNEKSVGRGFKDSGLSRDKVFITTKLWKLDMFRARDALHESLERLGLDYVDLFLIHWPFKGYQEAYLELEKLQKEGLCRAIGVSNFKIHHFEALKASGATVVPQVNQIECHPQNSEEELVNYCRRNKILVEAYSPLGGEGNILINDPRITTIAEYKKATPAQIILRWNLERGIAVIPKSVKAQRILENSQLYHFDFNQDDMDTLDSINTNAKRAFDPDLIDERPESTFPKIIEEV